MALLRYKDGNGVWQIITSSQGIRGKQGIQGIQGFSAYKFGNSYPKMLAKQKAIL